MLILQDHNIIKTIIYTLYCPGTGKRRIERRIEPMSLSKRRIERRIRPIRLFWQPATPGKYGLTIDFEAIFIPEPAGSPSGVLIP